MMKKYLFNPIRGVINIILILFILIFVAIITTCTALLVQLIPNKKWRHASIGFAQKLPVFWTDLNNLVIALNSYRKWDIQGQGELKPKGSYLLICNHSTWLDILALGYVFNHKTPIIKFFMKKQLLWSLPVAGLTCWLLGYPFLERHTREQIRKRPELKGKDLETTRKACQKFKEYPTTIMLFVEGTRFTPIKRERQASPYQHLLKPKATGVALVLEEIGKDLDGIIDATIHYTDKAMSIWKFATGDFGEISCHYQVLPIDPALCGDYYKDRAFRKTFQLWLNQTWQAKDELMQQLDMQDEPKKP